MTVEAVSELMKDENTYLIDCRPMPEYVAGHVPGSIWIQMENAFAIWAALIVDPLAGEKIVIVAPPGKEEEAITRLSRTGVDCAVGYLDGGFEAWTKAGLPVSKTKCLEYEGAEEFKSKSAGGRVIDVRNPGEWQDGVYGEATLLTLGAVKQAAKTATNKNEKLFMHCKGGARSLLAVSTLERFGFTDVTNIKGGFDNMKAKNVPIGPMTQQPVTTF